MTKMTSDFFVDRLRDWGVPDARFAEMLGLEAIYVDHADALISAWSDALVADRPAVIEVRTDPEVPPLPPHVTLAEAKAFMSSLAKGDRSVGQILANTARQLFGGSKS